MTRRPTNEDKPHGWERLGPFTRVAVVTFVLLAIGGFVVSAVIGEAWPLLIGAPAALLAGIVVRYAFASGDIDDEWR